MSQRLPSNGQGYTNYQNQLPDPHRSTFHSSINGLPNPSYPTSLPPLSDASSDLPSIQQQLQPSALSYQQPSFPPYAPTANVHFSNDLAPNTTAAPRPSYASAAPANLQLPKIQKIQPAPAGNGHPKHGLGPQKETLQPLASAAPISGQDTPPKHVVGSQGRRGILPSASGRPPALTNPSANGGKSSPQLAKDGDGKYPCPHCNKPYLHAKHLKRHMLRHTGVRPYECALCHDTFSRSDILKRHFQKCSVRRGNPTGENHLAYSRANKKAKQQSEEDMMTMTTEQVMPTYSASLDSPIGLAGMDLPHFDRNEPLANQVTRSNGMKVMGSNRGSASSLNFDNFSTGHVTPDSVTTSGAATPYTYTHERSTLNSPADATFSHVVGISPRYSSGYSNGSLPHIVGRNNHDFDWATLNGYASQEDFSGQSYHSGASTPHHSYKHNDTDFADFQFFPQHKS